MKAIVFIHFILLFFYCGCSNNNSSANTNDTDATGTVAATTSLTPDSFETGKVINVFSKTDASQSYALYIPSKGNKESLPVIYFFDPHGDGSLPLNKYKTLAENYNFILIGSNNSRNGNDWPVTENILYNLFDDTQKRLNINHNRIYICGFSGGAKVASYAALHNNNIKGVIAGGAGLPDGTSPGNFNFSFTGMAGEGDMNMTDLVDLNNELDKTQTKHRIIFFDGKHEWAPENIMNIAFTGLEFDAMRNKLVPVDDTFIKQYIAGSKNKINEYFATNKLIKSERECKLSISMLEGVSSDVNWFKEKATAIESNVSYQKQIQDQQNLFATEQSLKATYNQQFQNGGINYWTKTINDLQTKAKEKTAEGAMYQRLVAYLSLAFYSISNQLINSNQNDGAKYFVQLYKMDDPTNSEAWYFSAILNARSNNVESAQADLMKSVENGFNDKSRMEQQPEFQNLAGKINFQTIESKMKSR